MAGAAKERTRRRERRRESRQERTNLKEERREGLGTRLVSVIPALTFWLLSYIHFLRYAYSSQWIPNKNAMFVMPLWDAAL